MPKKKNPARAKKSPSTSKSKGKKPNIKDVKGDFEISAEDQIKYNKEYQSSLNNLSFHEEIEEDKIDPSSLWVDVYAPKTLEEYICDNQSLKIALQWLDDFKHKRKSTPRYLLMTGRPGIGKTTLAHLMLKNKDYDYQEYNASEIRSGSELRDHLSVFGRASIVSFFEGCSTVQKALIMDEIDGIDSKGKESDGLSTFLTITGAAQENTFSYPIICIANDESSSKIAKIRSKSCEIKMKDPSKKSLMTFLDRIMKGEKVKVDKKILSMIIEDSPADFRQVATKLHALVLLQRDGTNKKITVAMYNRIREKCKADTICGMSLTEMTTEIMDPKTDFESALRIYESDINAVSSTIFSSYIQNLDQMKVPDKDKFQALGRLSRSVLQGEIYSDFYWKYKTRALDSYQGAEQIGTPREVFGQMAKKSKIKLKWKNSNKRIFYLNPHTMDRIWRFGLALDIHSHSHLALTVETIWNLVKSKKFREKQSTYKKLLNSLFELGIRPEDFENLYKGFSLGGQATQVNEVFFKAVKPHIKSCFSDYSKDRSEEFQETLESSSNQLNHQSNLPPGWDSHLL